MTELFWCAGCQGPIPAVKVQILNHVGKRCRVCGSGRVVPVTGTLAADGSLIPVQPSPSQEGSQ